MKNESKMDIIAHLIASKPFYRHDLFTKYYSYDFTMDFPNAPSGMPNHYDTWQAERCFMWLNRTVKKWQTKLLEFYHTPQTNIYWAIGECEAEVHWGDNDGHFESNIYLKIELNDECQIKYLSLRVDPIEMLVAAGRKRADFDVEKAISKIDFSNFQSYHSLVDIDYVPLKKADSMSKEDIDLRIQYILDQHSCGVEREKYRHVVYQRNDFIGYGKFVPKQQEQAEMNHQNDKVNGLNKVLAWVKMSSPWMYRDPRNKVYPTNDPHIYFAEMNAHGPGCWKSIAGEVGHYKNEYLVYIEIDDQGYLKRWIEVLNSMNILNSSNVVFESFPYYY